MPTSIKNLRQPASAELIFVGDYLVFSTFCCINLKQQIEQAKKSAEAGLQCCLQHMLVHVAKAVHRYLLLWLRGLFTCLTVNMRK